MKQFTISTAVILCTAIGSVAADIGRDDAAQFDDAIISTRTFSGYEDVTSLALPRVKFIAPGAFDNLRRLTHLSLASESDSAAIWLDETYSVMNDSETGSSMFSDMDMSHIESFEIHRPVDCSYIDGDGNDGWLADKYPPLYPATLPMLPTRCCYGSSGLERVVLSDDIRCIRDDCFVGCKALTEVTLPRSIAWIGANSFSECDNLVTVRVLTGIPPTLCDNAFGSNRSGKTLIVPRGFTELYSRTPGWQLFGRIIEDETVVCEYTPEQIPLLADNRAFESNGIFSYRLVNFDERKAMLVSPHYHYAGMLEDGTPDFTAMTDYVLRPATIGSYDSEEIQHGYFARYNDADLTAFTVTEIGPYMFNGMTFEAELNIPPSVEYIHTGAFRSHDGLKTVWSYALTPPRMADNTVFGDKSELTLYVPEGCHDTYAKAPVWRDFARIVEDKRLGSNSIVGILAEATHVSADMFIGHDGEDALVLPRVESVQEYAFDGLANLRCISLGAKSEAATLSLIDNTSWREMTYGAAMFVNVNMRGLTSFELHRPVICGSGIGFSTGIYPEEDYPAAQPMVPSYCCYNSSKLLWVNLTDNIRCIAENCFVNCDALTEITLPSSLAWIGRNSFSGCDNLTTVRLKTGLPPVINESAFGPEIAGMKLTVPAGFKEVYAASERWSRFGEIAEDPTLTCEYTSADLPLLADRAGFPSFDCISFRTIDYTSETAMFVSSYYHYTGIVDGRPDFEGLMRNPVARPWLQNESTDFTDAYVYDLRYNRKFTITEIGPYTFSGMNFRKFEEVGTLNIPKTITRIHTGAFNNHSGLVNVNVYATEPPAMADGTVFGDKSGLTLCVPAGCSGAYASADVWKDFGTIIEDPALGYGSAEMVTHDTETAEPEYYTVDGRRVSAGAVGTGFYIVRYPDGTAARVRR